MNKVVGPIVILLIALALFSAIYPNHVAQQEANATHVASGQSTIEQERVLPGLPIWLEYTILFIVAVVLICFIALIIFPHVMGILMK